MELIIATLVALVIICFIIFRKNLSESAKQMLLSLVIAAEKTYGGGTGQLKFSSVAARLYEIMPSALQVMFSKAKIAQWIEDAVSYMKGYLADNKEAAKIAESEAAK
jgi:hypothetical protein